MIKVIKHKEAFISYEDMGEWVYLHEWKNKGSSVDGVRIGRIFLRYIKKPIIASSLKAKIINTALRNGFREYKKINNRTFLIRR